MAGTDPMAAEGTATDSPPNPADDFSSWIKKVRSEPTPPPENQSNNPGPRPRERLRNILMVMALGAISWFLYVLTGTASPSPMGMGLVGQLRYPRGQAVAGAEVFLTSDPTLATTTDSNGAFQLPNVPPGRQTIVIALEGVGQEYRVKVAKAGVTSMGDLPFKVPPSRIRQGLGGGAGWSGESPEEWAAGRTGSPAPQ